MHPLNHNKKATVGSMFDSIAFRYDFLNHLLSFGVDRMWRKKAIEIISMTDKKTEILDVATGTGDLAIAAATLNPAKITGIDISENMLKIGRSKIIKKGLSGIIELLPGDSEHIPFADKCFDVTMVAFGVRNFSDPLTGLSEMFRVLRDGGMIMVLEFSRPAGFPFREIYNFYFRRVLPIIGSIFSKNRNAYSYLPDSVMQFPDNEQFLDLLKCAGFTSLKQKKLSGGISSIYTGLK